MYVGLTFFLSRGYFVFTFLFVYNLTIHRPAAGDCLLQQKKKMNHFYNEHNIYIFTTYHSNATGNI